MHGPLEMIQIVLPIAEDAFICKIDEVQIDYSLSIEEGYICITLSIF